MIGIVIPAHNEQSYLDACLSAVAAAARHPTLEGEAVRVLVVLDACSDASAAVVARHAARSDGQCAIAGVAVQARNVGVARAFGAARMVEMGARWLAFTDADTRVSPAWLAMQLSLGVDVVCGTVAVDDWSPHREHGAALSAHFARSYTDADGHRHIHGANLGVAAAYLRAGGFEPLACSEDVALVDALERSGARFAWSAAPRVATSARRDAKARGGFGDTLLRYVAGLPA
ncbi:glycosyltransferase [Rugamonas sp.]|uniref:glycosyltransferase n=1 Tax=Rugamonas sp. TaxID=1926287 RepID=UPI0025D2260A|nr:glycosyltransferase [Rugamonas sp.]